MKSIAQPNNEIIVAFFGLIKSGIDRGYTLQEFYDFITQEQLPTTNKLECPSCGGDIRIEWANRFNACWNCDYTLKVEDIF